MGEWAPYDEHEHKKKRVEKKSARKRAQSIKNLADHSAEARRKIVRVEFLEVVTAIADKLTAINTAHPTAKPLPVPDPAKIAEMIDAQYDVGRLKFTGAALGRVVEQMEAALADLDYITQCAVCTRLHDHRNDCREPRLTHLFQYDLSEIAQVYEYEKARHDQREPIIEREVQHVRVDQWGGTYSFEDHMRFLQRQGASEVYRERERRYFSKLSPADKKAFLAEANPSWTFDVTQCITNPIGRKTPATSPTALDDARQQGDAAFGDAFGGPVYGADLVEMENTIKAAKDMKDNGDPDGAAALLASLPFDYDDPAERAHFYKLLHEYERMGGIELPMTAAGVAAGGGADEAVNVTNVDLADVHTLESRYLMDEGKEDNGNMLAQLLDQFWVYADETLRTKSNILPILDNSNQDQVHEKVEKAKARKKKTKKEIADAEQQERMDAITERWGLEPGYEPEQRLTTDGDIV